MNRFTLIALLALRCAPAWGECIDQYGNHRPNDSSCPIGAFPEHAGICKCGVLYPDDKDKRSCAACFGYIEWDENTRYNIATREYEKLEKGKWKVFHPVLPNDKEEKIPCDKNKAGSYDCGAFECVNDKNPKKWVLSRCRPITPLKQPHNCSLLTVAHNGTVSVERGLTKKEANWLVKSLIPIPLCKGDTSVGLEISEKGICHGNGWQYKEWERERTEVFCE